VRVCLNGQQGCCDGDGGNACGKETGHPEHVLGTPKGRWKLQLPTGPAYDSAAAIPVEVAGGGASSYRGAPCRGGSVPCCAWCAPRLHRHCKGIARPVPPNGGNGAPISARRG
jgi:hypothetical protein